MFRTGAQQGERDSFESIGHAVFSWIRDKKPKWTMTEQPNLCSATGTFGWRIIFRTLPMKSSPTLLTVKSEFKFVMFLLCFWPRSQQESPKASLKKISKAALNQGGLQKAPFPAARPSQPSDTRVSCRLWGTGRPSGA